ncbi:MAG: dolichol kinase [Planctomycetaceae bacterium]|nr:dolichol kinase [Planctomycetaceae bacterium]
MLPFCVGVCGWVWSHVNVFQVSTFITLVNTVWVIAGLLKSRGYLRAGDARKINHVTVLAGGVAWFNSADPLQDRVSGHVAVVILFGLLLMVCRWRELGLFRHAFHGYARESDRPHDGFHVWFSWLVSITGLELVDVLFGSLDLTRCAALVLGLADAVGEPIGSRFGRHRYHVRDILTATPQQRSWEGSLAVATMTSLIVFLSFSPALWAGWGTSPLSPMALRLPISILTGLLVSLVEAWTPHGLDNLTIPISAAVLVRGFALLAI